MSIENYMLLFFDLKQNEKVMLNSFNMSTKTTERQAWHYRGRICCTVISLRATVQDGVYTAFSSN